MKELQRTDAWAPDLGFGYWRVVYAECCDAVLAYDRIVAVMPAGAVRGRLLDLRPDLPARLASVARLAELAAALYPAWPERDPTLLALLADDPVKNLGKEHQTVPPDPGLREALLAARDELWQVAENAARLAVRLWENPHATDVSTWLTGLAAGVATALTAGTPTGYLADE
jgi:hypothetical protein